MAHSPKYQVITVDPETGWTRTSNGRWVSRAKAEQIKALWERHGAKGVRLMSDEGRARGTSRDPSSVTSTRHQGTPTEVRRRRLLRASKEEVRRLKAARAKGYTVHTEEMRRARAAVAAHSRRDPRRDPTTAFLPKDILTKKNAIDRATRKLASAQELDADARHKEARRIRKAIDRLDEHVRRSGYGYGTATYEATESMRKALWSAVTEATETASENYRAHLSRESERLRQEARERQPAHGSYERELALTRIGVPYKDYLRDPRRTRARRDPEDLEAFNTRLAKLMTGLKKEAGAETIRQNYRGTGSQKHRRQLWVHFKSGAVIDLWLDSGFLQLGGVVVNRPPGSTHTLDVRRIPYGDKTPEQVYREAATVLDAWANPKASGDPRRHRPRASVSGSPRRVRLASPRRRRPR